MHGQLFNDHHLQHFTAPEKAARYAVELSQIIMSANWLLIGAALEDQNAVALCCEIEPLDEDQTPYISKIQAVDESGQNIALADENLDLMVRGITEKDGRISVGAMALDWPLDMRLAILAREYLDSAYPDWNTPGAGAGTLVIDTDGQPVLTRHQRSSNDLE